jgi:hypothetical protein
MVHVSNQWIVPETKFGYITIGDTTYQVEYHPDIDAWEPICIPERHDVILSKGEIR